MQGILLTGFIIFLFLFFMGLHLEFSWSESLIASAVLTVVGLAVNW